MCMFMFFHVHDSLMIAFLHVVVLETAGWIRASRGSKDTPRMGACSTKEQGRLLLGR